MNAHSFKSFENAYALDPRVWRRVEKGSLPMSKRTLRRFILKRREWALKKIREEAGGDGYEGE